MKRLSGSGASKQFIFAMFIGLLPALSWAQVGTPCTCNSGQAGRCLTGSVDISAPGLYCLTQDFSSSSGFHISADNVVLDGQNHKMNITGGVFFHVAKDNDPSLPSFKIRTYNLTVRNFNVEANNISYNDIINLDTVSNSLFENNVIKLLGGTSSTGAKLMGMYQSYLNRFVGNTFIVTKPSGGIDLFSIRNGTCGTHFINNTFVAPDLGSGSHFIKLNSGDQTLGRGAVADTVFSGNRIFSSVDGILDQSHQASSGLTLVNNLIYSSGDGISSGPESAAKFELRGNTIISLDGKPLHVDGGDGKNLSLLLKNNILIAAGGGLTMDIHIESIASDYNNFYNGLSSGLIWSRYDGIGGIVSGTFNCLTGCGAPWLSTLRDPHSLSQGGLTALFVDPNVNLVLNSNKVPTHLGDFNLKAGSPLRSKGEGGVDLGSPGLNGSSLPLICSVPKPGLSPGDATSPSAPNNLQLQ